MGGELHRILKKRRCPFIVDLVDTRGKWARMRRMRSLLAILFSVVLILSQAASVHGAGESNDQKASAAKCCGHCGPCKGGHCCAGNKSSDPRQPAPAVPSQGFSPNDLQVLVCVSLQFLPQISTEPAMVPSSRLAPPSVAAPLYQRDCSYLI